MAKDIGKINFDMSVLGLKELVEVYAEINDFVKVLNDTKIVEEAKEE